MAFDDTLTRRQLLKGAVVLGAASAVGGPVLAACGGGGETTEPSPTAAGAPKKGGHIMSGVSGGSAKDELDAHTAYRTVPQIAMQWQLYDALLGFDPEHKLINLLAESYEASDDAVVHTVRLKSGLVFHDGKPVTADDVVFTYKRILDPKTNASGADQLSDLSPSGIEKLDDLTVRFTLDRPNAVFWEALAFFPNAIVPVGYSPRVGEGLIGTGPWVMKNYVPGERADFTANPDYWGEGPFADELSMIQFADATARLNALIDGQVDHIELVEPAQVPIIESNSDLVLLQAKSGGWKPFTMRIDQKPFDDVRVRQAMRLIADREQMISHALSGYAWLGNDMYAPFDPGYPSDLPQREQDLEQAKSLLKQAGYDNNLTVKLTTSTSVSPGAPAAATVFARQAKGAGVDVKVDNVTGDVFWGDEYLKYQFAMDNWGTRGYLEQAGMGSMPDAYYNETHWDHPEWLALVEEAFKTVDDAKRNELITQASTIEYNEGGYIIYAFDKQVDAHSTKVAGVIPDVSGLASAANNARYRLAYFV